MQDGRDMAEFGADKEKDSFWMSCTGLEGELVVQMEDDMNKDVGRLSNEDKPACCRPKTSISSQFHDNMVPLFFLTCFLIFPLYISTPPPALTQSPKAQIMPHRMNIKK